MSYEPKFVGPLIIEEFEPQTLPEVLMDKVRDFIGNRRLTAAQTLKTSEAEEEISDSSVKLPDSHVVNIPLSPGRLELNCNPDEARSAYIDPETNTLVLVLTEEIISTMSRPMRIALAECFKPKTDS